MAAVTGFSFAAAIYFIESRSILQQPVGAAVERRACCSQERWNGLFCFGNVQMMKCLFVPTAGLDHVIGAA